MAKALVRGSQIKEQSVTDFNLAKDSVITEKIKDGNVTCEKLAPGLCERFLSNPSPIARVKLKERVPARTDFELPNEMKYELNSFIDRVAIYRNGQLLFNGLEAPIDDEDPTEVFPGENCNKIQFDMELRKGDTIQVIIL